MSFKDVRDLAEHLKLLGFPNSRWRGLQTLATNFGNLAAFHLVAEILQWLAGLLEPGAVLQGGVDGEENRIALIRSATEFFVTKSAIKLNPRKLYAASAVTATELQKITKLLIAPTQSDQEKDDEENYRSLNQVDIGDKMDDLRRARELSSDLTQRGAALYDLLSKEMVNKEARLAQSNRPMELASVERTLKNAISAAQIKLQSSKAQLENSRVEMNALNSKLQRKRAELERTKQRLDALQKIRPAHMQEFEDCEKELQDLFQKYFLRIHVRDALRAQFEARNKRATPVASPILQKPSESSMPFIPEGLIEDDDDADFDDEAQLDGVAGGNKNRRNKFGLDNEIYGIRDEDLIAGDRKRGADRKSNGPTASGKRPGTATSRVRPTTGRSRKSATATDVATARSDALRSRATGGTSRMDLANKSIEDDDSSFGSSDSDLDMGGLLGTSMTGAAKGDVGMMGISSEISGLGDDDFDLNSIDDISISKITGDLPLRPKTANKQEHHSDEDF